MKTVNKARLQIKREQCFGRKSLCYLRGKFFFHVWVITTMRSHGVNEETIEPQGKESEKKFERKEAVGVSHRDMKKCNENVL